jgi:hypothetical protein
VNEQLQTALDMNREQLMEELEMKRVETRKLKEETDRAVEERKKKIVTEIENEKKNLKDKKIPTNNVLFTQSMPTLDRRTTFNKYSSISGLQSIKIEDTNKSPELKNQIIIPLISGENTSEAVLENNIHNRNDTENINPPLPSIEDDQTFQLE